MKTLHSKNEKLKYQFKWKNDFTKKKIFHDIF
jgi:hypothetical protein